MKKDHLILIALLTLMAVSGAVIWVLKSPQPGSANRTQDAPEASDEMRISVRRWETSLAIDPNNLDLLVKLGNAYYDLNEPQKSIEYYERALTIKPDLPFVLVDCGAMYRQTGQPDKAIELFEKAIDLDPGLAQAYFNLGAVLRIERDDARGAARAWQKYLELVPDPDPQIKDLLMSEIEEALGKQAE